MAVPGRLGLGCRFTGRLKFLGIKARIEDFDEKSRGFYWPDITKDLSFELVIISIKR